MPCRFDPEQYAEAVDDAKSERTVRKFFEKRQHYDLVVAHGATRGRTYRPVTSTPY